MVALDHDRAAPGLFLDALQHRFRVGAVADQIAEEGVSVGPLLPSVGHHRHQGFEVRVDVGEEREPHEGARTGPATTQVDPGGM